VARKKDQNLRRSQILTAAADELARRGREGLRLKDVADAAGVTSGAILYYYADLADLLAAVFISNSKVYVKRRQRAIETHTSWPDKLVACIRTGVPAPQLRQSSQVLFELYPLSFRNHALAAHQRQFIRDQTALYEGVLDGGSASGDFRLRSAPSFHARQFVALEDGYAMDVLSGERTSEEVIAALLTHAEDISGAALGAPTSATGRDELRSGTTAS
jgi:AcrR family transcriptional regulator